MKVKLHHFAYNITPNNLELVSELFEKFDCVVSYKEKNARWCLFKQESIPVNIQIIETKDTPIATIDKKINMHIAFLSDFVESDIKEIKQWSENKNVKFKHGKWSENEQWFDLPDIFVNFVVEIMSYA